MRIPVSGPSITAREIGYVTDAVTNAWYASHNIYHEKFERAFAEHLGLAHAIALPSCTSAIHLSLLALGIGPGDEVVVPELTWIATAAPISQVGALPIFADVDPETWCLSAAAFEAAITPRTRAVIPVDLYGGMPDWSAIQAIAAAHDIAIIEDAAEGVGARYESRPAGSFGATGVFSFHGSKTLTTGEGGLVATDDPALHQRMLFLRDHGRGPGDRMFHNAEVAYKYKMSSMQAALGLAQLERLPELIEGKRRVFEHYRRRLQGRSGLRLNAEPPGVFNSYWMVTVVWDHASGWKKEVLMQEMDRKGIDCRPIFYPLSGIPAYAAHPFAANAAERNPVAYDISARGLNLPSGLNLTEDEIDYVADVLLNLFESM
ncbi:MAG: perosamine synthetase [Nevskia sp.]|nr:perosamine synthetase [Nevskia sp.]